MSVIVPGSPQTLALNRFGLGARPGESIPADPRRWLTDQLAAYNPGSDALEGTTSGADLMRTRRAAQRAVRRDGDAMRKGGAREVAEIRAADKAQRLEFRRQARGAYRAGVDARILSALKTETPFVERLVHFWANHFCISADNPSVQAYATDFECEAIRPHVLGRFEDMLMAVEKHPAMLIYLNQVNSVGPRSDFAKRRRAGNPRPAGLNENLARETFELHTMGVRSGYTQADVTEYARALTGWTVDGIGPGSFDGDDDGFGFTFLPRLHEPGTRRILGKNYAQDGIAQAETVLHDLVRAPEAARFIATKLARHFVADAPPPALVARLAESFRQSGGDLPTLYRSLIDAPEAWAFEAPKFKTPWEWTISVLRGTGRRDLRHIPASRMLTQLGQQVWRPGSPAGWDDMAPTWATPVALLRRVEIVPRLVAGAAGSFDARMLAPDILPGALSQDTATQIARAESPLSALALLFVSPEFLRR